MRHGSAAQPPPTPGRLAVWPEVMEDIRRLDSELSRKVLEDMAARDATGRERYGRPLETHNGRDHLVDAYQESLDCVVYLYAACLEGAALSGAYTRALALVFELGGELLRRDGTT